MFVAVLISGKCFKCMTQPLDFSNQDLRNRSFKGQNLAGANFRKADIRGCDFSKANLEGADFSGVTAGQSGKQIFVEVAAGAFAGAVAVKVTLVAGGFVGGFAGAFAGIVVGILAGVLVKLSPMLDPIANRFRIPRFRFPRNEDTLEDAGFVVVGGFVGGCANAFADAFMVAFAEIGKGNILGGTGYILLGLFLFSIVYGLLMIAIIGTRYDTGTSFSKAKLTNSKFTGAILNNCNFIDAKIHQIDWTHTHFMRCRFSVNLNNQLIRELCVYRIGANENFSSMNLSGLNLIGVNFCGANLAAANLSQTNLSQSDLTNANLSNIQAIKTDFTNANLSGACIENWAITSETIFTDVICSHIFLDLAKSERKPASGSLKQGDFAKLVTQSTKSLDFFFRNGIDPQAFDFALNNLMDNYSDMGISLKSVEDFGDGDRIVRFNTVSNAPKGEMHAQFTQDYEEMHQQLEASRNKVYELQQKLDRIDLENRIERFELEKQLAVAVAKLEERPTSQYLQNLVYHQANQKLLYAPYSKFGDTMTDKSIQSGGDVFFTGRDNLGVSGKDQQGVAGRDLSGTVTNTIQQLRETNQPEAPKLSDLLEQLQKAVESSSELGETDKEKALEYLNQIGNMSAKDPSQKKGMLPILLDAFTGVISKAANLIEPVKKIADAILSIWQA
jgi:uncharacterized protein YjbI with pentapeptide repeats